jgi:hypothetical protein
MLCIILGCVILPHVILVFLMPKVCPSAISHFGGSQFKCVPFWCVIVVYVILVFLISNVCHSVVLLCYMSFWCFSYQMCVIPLCHCAIVHFGGSHFKSVSFCYIPLWWILCLLLRRFAKCHFSVSHFLFKSFCCHCAVSHFGGSHIKCMSFWNVILQYVILAFFNFKCVSFCNISFWCFSLQMCHSVAS